MVFPSIPPDAARSQQSKELSVRAVIDKLWPIDLMLHGIKLGIGKGTDTEGNQAVEDDHDTNFGPVESEETHTVTPVR